MDRRVDCLVVCLRMRRRDVMASREDSASATILRMKAEVETFLIRTLHKLLAKHDSQHYSGYFAALAIRGVLNAVDYDSYVTTDRIVFPGWDPEECARELAREPEGAKERARLVAEELLESTVSVQLLLDSISAEIGQAIPCHLEVRVLGNLAAAAEGSGTMSLSYEVLQDGENWVVQGWRKRGVELHPAQPATVPLMLLPLRSGSLTLPTVLVRADGADDVDVVRPRQGEQVIVMPRRAADWFL
ncbi:hypothetical protein HDU93_009689 [Gonapodya sp. JEL0774]|nr:hypothetical protein HDU93_009689 [Gonapodya sp. JEL0774]